MKNKILIFIIGVLVGAIIASIGFYAYSKTNSNKEFTPGQRPEMSDQNGDRQTPPDMPNGERGGNKEENNSQVPEKTSDTENTTATDDSTV